MVLPSKEIITSSIAIISFLLSVFNAMYLLLTNRKNIKLTYKKHVECTILENNPIYFELIIENCSRLNISISRMFLNVGLDTYEFNSSPEFIYEFVRSTGPTVTDRKTYYSNSLPQSINGLGALGGFFWVNTSKSFNYQTLYESNVSISLYTNRGKLQFPIVCTKE